jgi:GNAT superfamily N-acetyltransferase
MLATAQIEELDIPAGLDDPAAADFIEMVRVRNTIEHFAVGTDALVPTAAELLPVFTSAFEPKRLFVARVDGSIVGRAVLDLPIGGDSRSAWLLTEVLPDFRGNGIGTQLFDRVETLALDAGRTVLQAHAMHTATEGGERLPSPTGFGDLPMEDPGVRFLLRRGYRLEQVERMSVLPLPVDRDALQRIVDEGAARVAPEYRLVTWSGRTPAERVEDLLMLHTRMSVDAPFAGLDIEDEPWTPARLDEYETSFETSERRGLTAAVEHVAGGSLVGFSVLAVPDDRSRPAQQDDTLVTIGHRGHGLGMLMKAANLLALTDLAPIPPSVVTGNAEENRHMLDINEALGFRPAGSYGCWRKA